MNRSVQREIILDVLRSTTSHPTAEWIYERARRQLPNISLGTVYRNLNALVAAGVIIKVQGSFDKDRFDGNAVRHAHMVCDRCGAVIDVDLPQDLDFANMNAVKNCEVLIKDYSIVYKGICNNCLACIEENNIV